MPKRKYASTTPTKKRKRTRRGTYRKMSRLSSKMYSPGRDLGRLGFPPRLKVVHKYCDRNINSSAGPADYNYSFCANGMFDPNITGVGIQPLYFDQMTPIYNHYVVIGSEIKVTIIPRGTAVQEAYRALLFLNDDAANPTNFDTAWSQRTATTRFCQGGVNPDRIVMKKRYSAKKTFPGAVMSNSNLRGSGSANPAELAVFHLMIRANDGIGPVAIDIFYEIKYIAVWFELKDIALS